MEIRSQIQHFEKYRELRDVPKQPLAQEGPVPEGVWVRQSVEDLFQNSRALDNQDRDYDPGQGQILRWDGRMASAAHLKVEGENKSLDRSNITAYRRDIYRVRQDKDSIAYLDALVERDGYLQMQCWHLNLKDWEASFYQCL